MTFGPVVLPGPDGVSAARALRPEHLAFADWHFHTFALEPWIMPLTCPCCRLQRWAQRALYAARRDEAMRRLRERGELG